VNNNDLFICHYDVAVRLLSFCSLLLLLLSLERVIVSDVPPFRTSVTQSRVFVPLHVEREREREGERAKDFFVYNKLSASHFRHKFIIMGKKKGKRRFIDKKTANRFFLLHRSQADPLYHLDAEDGGSKLILHPADRRTAEALERMKILDDREHQNDSSTDDSAARRPQNYFQTYCAVPSEGDAAASSSSGEKHASTLVKEVREVEDKGFLVDGYDYSQHLCSMSSSGVFISAGSGRKVTGGGHVYSAPSSSAADNENKITNEIPEEIVLAAQNGNGEETFGRMLEAITLRPSCMDDDIRRALEIDQRDDGDDIEELNDDFMENLLSLEDDAKAAEAENGEDTFDYDAHIARLMAEAEAEDAELFGQDESDEEEEFYGDEGAALPSNARDVDVYFEKFLESYEDDEIGELDEEDPRVEGHLEQDSKQVDRILQQYLQDKDEERVQNAGATNTVSDAARRHILETTAREEEAAASSETLARGAIQFDDDEVDMTQALGDYAKPKRQSHWDCESIVSTYSNLDNHPSVVGSEILSLRKKKKVAPRIRASIPETIEATYSSDDEGDEIVVNKGERRRRGETKAEKKARKMQLKAARRERRQEKKALKIGFKMEKAKQVAMEIKSAKGAGGLGTGTSTFKL